LGVVGVLFVGVVLEIVDLELKCVVCARGNIAGRNGPDVGLLKRKVQEARPLDLDFPLNFDFLTAPIRAFCVFLQLDLVDDQPGSSLRAAPRLGPTGE